MRILLIGEYSNLHATLAIGLRQLGHQVTVASNGDFWKDYRRDIDISRKSGGAGGLRLFWKIWRNRHLFEGFDVVQVINPMFVELKADKIFHLYDFLRKNNGKMVLGAFGMDHYWVNECITRKHLRYSDFNIGDKLRTDADAIKEQKEWIGTDKERLNKYIANDCDAIVACLYEYWSCYQPIFPQKTHFIPLPIKIQEHSVTDMTARQRKIKIFCGVNKTRSEYKGTDIMLKAIKKLDADYPGVIDLRIAESVPFDEYQSMMDGADIILDQLYSYTPSMNSLLAMSKGIVCVGGGEPENYDIICEKELRPVINVFPTEQSVYEEMKKIILNPNIISQLKNDSIIYVQKHHDYMKVAQRYERLYTSLQKKAGNTASPK